MYFGTFDVCSRHLKLYPCTVLLIRYNVIARHTGSPAGQGTEKLISSPGIYMQGSCLPAQNNFSGTFSEWGSSENPAGRRTLRAEHEGQLLFLLPGLGPIIACIRMYDEPYRFTIDMKSSTGTSNFDRLEIDHILVYMYLLLIHTVLHVRCGISDISYLLRNRSLHMFFLFFLFSREIQQKAAEETLRNFVETVVETATDLRTTGDDAWKNEATATGYFSAEEARIVDNIMLDMPMSYPSAGRDGATVGACAVFVV